MQVIRATETNSDLIFKELWLWALVCLVPPWKYSAWTCLCFTQLRVDPWLGKLPDSLCWKHLKTQYLLQQSEGKKQQLGQTISRLNMVERKRLGKEIYGKWGLLKAPAYTKKLKRPCTYTREESCPEKTWEDAKILPLQIPHK